MTPEKFVPPGNRPEHFPGVSIFRARVFVALHAVPKGRVISYGELGKAAGCGSARAVGGAVRMNPFWPDVPCHRVIASDFTIGGFHGQKKGSRIRQKMKLLESEGVFFENGKLKDRSQFITAKELKKHIAL